MLLTLSPALSIKTRYIEKRGNVFQFVMRVPADLIKRYGKDRIRESLGTTDLRQAMMKADSLAKRHLLHFKVLQENSELTPVEISRAAAHLSERWEDFDSFISEVIEPKREKYSKGDTEIHDSADPSEYLTPIELAVADRFREGKDAVRLSTALEFYWKTHKKAGDAAFTAKVNRDWDKLMNVLGDITVMSLSRQQARQFVDHCLAHGLKTTSVRRTINHINAILNVAIRESEITKQNPFSNLPIAGEGKDSRETRVATTEQLKEVAAKFAPQTSSAVPLMICMTMELGTRIGEVSGLGIDDVFLDGDIPHVYFRDRPWRSLKNDESERRVPVVGVALEALRAAVELPREGKGLFDAYAKLRGNDNASQAVNQRLKDWGLTSHSFRHAMKDRLREAGCPKDIRDAIQGHSSGDVADNYGQGHTLRTMHGWLSKIAITLP
jgi:integrase